MGPKPNGRCVFIRERFDRGRGWGDAGINQGISRPTRAGGGHDVSPLEPSEGAPGTSVPGSGLQNWKGINLLEAIQCVAVS